MGAILSRHARAAGARAASASVRREGRTTRPSGWAKIRVSRSASPRLLQGVRAEAPEVAPKRVAARLASGQGFLAGVPLKSFDRTLADCLLVAVTEKRRGTRSDAFVAALEKCGGVMSAGAYDKLIFRAPPRRGARRSRCGADVPEFRRPEDPAEKHLRRDAPALPEVSEFDVGPGTYSRLSRMN